MFHELPVPELLTHFEGLGNNCEFGIVQRASGYDPPGLFRNVGFLRTEQIIAAIGSALDGMFDDGAFSFVRPDGWPDHALRCERFGFLFHTGVPAGDDSEAAFTRVIDSFRFLKRKLLADMRGGDKMFVYRHIDDTEVTGALADRLLRALCQHGDNWLLLVRQDKRPERRFGWAGLATGGLINASVPKLSNENPPQIDFAAWEKITRLALHIRAGFWESGSEERRWRENGAERLMAMTVRAPHDSDWSSPAAFSLSDTIPASNGTPGIISPVRG